MSTFVQTVQEVLATRRDDRTLARMAASRWKDELPLNEVATAALIGLFDGEPGLCAVTETKLVLATSSGNPPGVRVFDLADVYAVVLDSTIMGSSLIIRVADKAHVVGAFRGGRLLEAFTRALAERIHQRTDPAKAIVGQDGTLMALVGNHVGVAGSYLGGYPKFPDAELSARLVLDDRGVHLLVRRRVEAVYMPWSEVSQLLIEAAEEMRRRITATRLLAVGWLALAIPKDERHDDAYVAAATATGAVILRTSQTPHAARAHLGAYLATGTRNDDHQRSEPADDLADALGRLTAMRDRGHLTDQEFAAAKAQILGL